MNRLITIAGGAFATLALAGSLTACGMVASPDATELKYTVDGQLKATGNKKDQSAPVNDGKSTSNVKIIVTGPSSLAGAVINLAGNGLPVGDCSFKTDDATGKMTCTISRTIPRGTYNLVGRPASVKNPLQAKPTGATVTVS